jgi:hypothetical protein
MAGSHVILTGKEATMKTALALALAAAGLLTFVQPASACPAGYEAVWIQGHKVCKIKTPNLSLKAKEKRQLLGSRHTKKSR